MRRFLDDAASLVVEHGGSISGEHGDGQSKAELLPKMFGPELIEAFREFKSIWDPDWKMNPGKVVDPFPITSNMRLGPDYVPPHVHTHFSFPNDEGNFSRAAIRCVGVGKCRSAVPGDNVMCPSYMATREEAYVTRGRARLLFEMLHGGATEKTWNNPAVEKALDLCLACKGCKRDCPVNVDMATYKAEFRSHYYENKIRPRSAYSMASSRSGRRRRVMRQVSPMDWPATRCLAHLENGLREYHKNARSRPSRLSPTRPGGRAIPLSILVENGFFCSRTPSITISGQQPPSRRPSCLRPQDGRWSSRRSPCAAGVRFTTGACSKRRKMAPADHRQHRPRY